MARTVKEMDVIYKPIDCTIFVAADLLSSEESLVDSSPEDGDKKRKKRTKAEKQRKRFKKESKTTQDGESSTQEISEPDELSDDESFSSNATEISFTATTPECYSSDGYVNPSGSEDTTGSSSEANTGDPPANSSQELILEVAELDESVQAAGSDADFDGDSYKFVASSSSE